MAKYKLRKLEELLQNVDGFQDPKIELEQYDTPASLAAQMLHHIESQYDDFSGQSVADLGCGSGRLLLGAGLLGARYCLGIDVDSDALDLCRHNVEDCGLDSAAIDLLQLDLLQLESDKVCMGLTQKFDCVIMNPPFGTKNNAGIDMKFVRHGLQLTTRSVYSLHKTSTREYVVRAAKSWGVEVKVMAELRFNLPHSYSFHRLQSKDIEVDLVRFERTDATPSLIPDLPAGKPAEGKTVNHKNKTSHKAGRIGR